MRPDRRNGKGSGSGRLGILSDRMRELYARNADEIERRFPKVPRNVAGYNINRLGREDLNLAELLVGSEGTLAWFQELKLALQPIPAHKVLGICHFPTFHGAMESVRHIIRLDPAATELIDRTVLELAAEIPAFSSSMRSFIRGTPVAVLLVEFAGDDLREQLRNLDRLEELMGDLGLPDSVLRAESAALQARVWSLRKAALNIVMSMKGDGKPISFVEDCAVPLENLAEYTQRLTDVFSRHGTTGTWYAHAGAGCLHVRPILNLKQTTTSRTGGRSLPRRMNWSANTRVPTRVSMATAWSGPSSWSPYSARRSCPHSARSRTVSTRTGDSIRARSSIRRRWTIAAC